MKRTTAMVFLVMLGVGAYLALAPGTIHVGQVRISEKASERLAVTRPLAQADLEDPAMLDEAPPGTLQAILPGAEIPFANPEVARNWIDPTATYQVTELPFELGLEEAELIEEPDARNTLRIRDAVEEHSEQIDLGATLSIGDDIYKIAELRRWAGVLPDPEGMPHVAIGIRGTDGMWLPPLILSEISEARIDDVILVRMSWHASESEARSAIEAGPQPPGPPRWGIVDGVGVQWFEGVVPGTGAIRGDGVEVTLVDVETTEEGRDVLIFMVRDNDDVHLERVDPTKPEESPLVVFDRVAQMPSLLWIHGWRDRVAMAAYYSGATLVEEAKLDLGDSWELPEQDLAIRLEGALATGTPVRPEDSPFYQAVLAGKDDHWLFLREGETERVNDYQVRYHREQDPPEMAYHLYVQQNGTRSEFNLEAETAFRVGSWAFHPGTPDPRMPHIAIVKVDYHQRDWLGRAGVVLATIGFVGLVVTALTRFSGAS